MDRKNLGRVRLDRGRLRPLDELRAGEVVLATVTSHHPWGLSAALHEFEPVGASLDVIRRGSEPAIHQLAQSMPVVGAALELVIGRVKPWHHAPWVWVDLTADTPAGGPSTLRPRDEASPDGSRGPVMGSYFQRVQWIHDAQEDPVVLWAQVVDGWEVRKVDEFRDGHLAWADDTREDGATGLGQVPVPRPEAIATDPQFAVQIIDRSDFERVWRMARGDASGASLGSL